MEKEIFDLLVDISNNGFINIEIQGNIVSTEQRIVESEKLDKLNYLLSQGFISRRSRYVFIITEVGYEVSKYSTWIDYIIHQKEIRDRKIKKESIDLKISEFQIRTKFLPYFISAISMLISLVALTDPFNWGENKYKRTEPPMKNIQLDTVSHTNKDHLDTVTQYNHTPLK